VWKYTIINDRDCDFVSIRFQDEASNKQTIANSICLLACYTTIDPNGKFLRINILCKRSRFEVLRRFLRPSKGANEAQQ
jgi:hypothetical protein